MKNRISAEVKPDDFNTLMGHLTNLEKGLPFLINLSDKERRRLMRLGTRSVEFVNDASDAVRNFPQILPPRFEVQEFLKDTVLYGQLRQMQMKIESLHEKLQDTLAVVGNEAMMAALDVYSYVQTAAPSEPGLKSVADTLSERFKKQSFKKDDGAAPPTQA